MATFRVSLFFGMGVDRPLGGLSAGLYCIGLRLREQGRAE